MGAVGDQHQPDGRVQVQFFAPCAALRPYISTYYRTDVAPVTDGTIADLLHPEWANVRFVTNGTMRGGVGPDGDAAMARVIGCGPTSLACRFATAGSTTWGIGLLPLGWHRFVAAPANVYADRWVDGESDPAFAALAAIAQRLDTAVAAAPGDSAAHAAAIEAQLLAIADAADARALTDRATIAAAHRALVDEGVATVSALADATARSPRALERISLRAFGFAPKLLLRRQRFLRSLARFMLDPSLKWIDTLDSGYHDQAHFIRDFQRFMGMSPGRYAAMPHPVLMAAAHARMASAGAAMQALHRVHD